MPRIKLTDRTIPALRPPTSGRITYVDRSLSGFGLRVTSNGAKSWTLTYHRGKRVRRVTLGQWPHLGLADARNRARELLATIVQGADPAEERRAAREAPTVADLVADYLEHHAKRTKRSWRVDERMLKRDVLPRWGARRASEVRRRDVQDLLDALVDRDAGVQANRLLSLLKKLWNHGLARELVELNPCLGIARPTREQPRTRTFSDEELRRLYAAIEQEPADVTGVLKLMLWTGARHGEVRAMRWDEVDLQAGVWSIPAKTDKAKVGRRVPLVRPAIGLLTQLRERAPGAVAFVFPGDGENGYRRGLQRATERVVERSGVAFVPHDLRAAVGTGMALLGYHSDLIAAALGHVRRDITSRHYIRTTREPEVRTALEAWSRRLQGIITGEPAGKVIPLRA